MLVSPESTPSLFSFRRFAKQLRGSRDLRTWIFALMACLLFVITVMARSTSGPGSDAGSIAGGVVLGLALPAFALVMRSDRIALWTLIGEVCLIIGVVGGRVSASGVPPSWLEPPPVEGLITVSEGDEILPRSVDVGDLRVEVVSVVRETAPIDRLRVEVLYTNISETRKIDDVRIDPFFAELSDKHGNRYRRLGEERVTEEIVAGTLYPGEALRLEVRFEPPILRFGYLELELPVPVTLPATREEFHEMIRFRVLGGAIVGHPDLPGRIVDGRSGRERAASRRIDGAGVAR